MLSEVAQSCPTLCNPMDCSLPGFSVYGIFQARILEWVAISFSRRSSQPRDWTRVSRIVGRCFTLWALKLTKWILLSKLMQDWNLISLSVKVLLFENKLHEFLCPLVSHIYCFCDFGEVNKYCFSDLWSCCLLKLFLNISNKLPK